MTAEQDVITHIVRGISERAGSFLLDSPPGCHNARNLPYTWDNGHILLGWEPAEVLTIRDRPNIDLASTINSLAACVGSRHAIAVGFLSYDLGGYIETCTMSRHAPDPLPLVHFALYTEYLSYCQESGALCLHRSDGTTSNVTLSSLSLDAGATYTHSQEVCAPRGEVTSNFTQDEYITAVGRAKEYILSGDIYEVNLSQRFMLSYGGSPAELYLRLRRYNPAPYGAFFKGPDWAVLSSSPELFLSIRGNHIVTRPIKGTARRSADTTADATAAGFLANSVKDNAELAMIVDLERNDLGRVCRYGSVKVAEAKRVETFARVHHLVSTVEGTLREESDLGAIFAATFPGGSITGAPKIRAMQVIDELEPCRRGVYTGAIGYILPGGRAEFNIAIRSIISRAGELSVQVGGAVTSDSVPEAEYHETLAKAEAMLAAAGVRDIATMTESAGTCK